MRALRDNFPDIQFEAYAPVVIRFDGTFDRLGRGRKRRAAVATVEKDGRTIFRYELPDETYASGWTRPNPCPSSRTRCSGNRRSFRAECRDFPLSPDFPVSSREVGRSFPNFRLHPDFRRATRKCRRARGKSACLGTSACTPKILACEPEP